MKTTQASSHPKKHLFKTLVASLSAMAIGVAAVFTLSGGSASAWGGYYNNYYNGYYNNGYSRYYSSYYNGYYPYYNNYYGGYGGYGGYGNYWNSYRPCYYKYW